MRFSFELGRNSTLFLEGSCLILCLDFKVKKRGNRRKQFHASMVSLVSNFWILICSFILLNSMRGSGRRGQGQGVSYANVCIQVNCALHLQKQ